MGLFQHSLTYRLTMYSNFNGSIIFKGPVFCANNRMYKKNIHHISIEYVTKIDRGNCQLREDTECDYSSISRYPRKKLYISLLQLKLIRMSFVVEIVTLWTSVRKIKYDFFLFVCQLENTNYTKKIRGRKGSITFKFSKALEKRRSRSCISFSSPP